MTYCQRLTEYFPTNEAVQVWISCLCFKITYPNVKKNSQKYVGNPLYSSFKTKKYVFEIFILNMMFNLTNDGSKTDPKFIWEIIGREIYQEDVVTMSSPTRGEATKIHNQLI